jgi:hypothetical protein
MSASLTIHPFTRSRIGQLSDELHPAFALAFFGATLLIDVLQSLPDSSNGHGVALYRTALVIGGLMAIAVPFALWVYFIGATYVALLLMNQYVDIPQLSRIFCVSVMVAGLGKLVTCVLNLVEMGTVGRWVYIVSCIGALGVAIYGIHRDLRVPKEDACLAVGLAFGALEGMFYLTVIR